MKNLNNFDLSSNGVSIELDVCFDCDLARFWFDETFHVLQHSGYHQNYILVYGAHIVDVSDFKFNDLDNWDIEGLTSKEIFKRWIDSICSTGYSNMGYQEIRDGLQELDHYCDIIPLKECEQQTMLEAIENYCDVDFVEFLESNFTPKFAKVVSRGYSQGDYSEVIIPSSVLSEFPDQTLETIGDFLSDEIDHLLWDAPIRCNVSVDGVDVNLSHLLPDWYDWDKQTAIDVFNLGMDKSLSKKQYKTLISFLRENLPETPDYSH